MVEKPSNQSITVIMAGPHWGLNWFPEHHQGVGSYHAVAEVFDPETDALPDTSEVATYFVFGHHSEIPLQYTIPEELAIVGIREFFGSPDRPPSLKWELD